MRARSRHAAALALQMGFSTVQRQPQAFPPLVTFEVVIIGTLPILGLPLLSPAEVSLLEFAR